MAVLLQYNEVDSLTVQQLQENTGECAVITGERRSNDGGNWDVGTQDSFFELILK